MLFLNESAFRRFFLFFNTLSRNLSDNSTNKLPIINPVAGNNHTMYPSSVDKSIAGESKDQNEAAIITPALKPKIVFKTFLFTSLKKQTTREPRAVIAQVKRVAISA